MKLLTEFPDTEIFYRGTIIVLKDMQKTPTGDFDIMYCLIGDFGKNFAVLDLYRSMGSCILHDLKPNVKGHVGVNKQGIIDWVTQYFKHFYTEEGYVEYVPKINEFLYIANLSDYFTQSNRNLFMK
jgi:hypothetical protein